VRWTAISSLDEDDDQLKCGCASVQCSKTFGYVSHDSPGLSYHMCTLEGCIKGYELEDENRHGCINTILGAPF
jgi:hypothetical protein